jgi:pimeloyl-ACP methyl ester carboxylesterase
MNPQLPTTSMSALATLALVLAGLAPWTRGQSSPIPAPQVSGAEDSVRSKDGTRIAFDRSGRGPALILVAPALTDRTGETALAKLLSTSFTVINYDRRGRGGSGDTQPYAFAREIEDIDALIEEVGGTAYLFGSSSGAVLALEAANTLSTRVKAAVLFEPPFIVDDSRPPIPTSLFERIGSLVAADRRGDAVALFMRDGIGVPEEMLGMMRQSPMWAPMERLAHTLPYEGALLSGLQLGKPLPAKRWTSVTARTLVLDGELSDTFLRNAALALTRELPGSKRHTLVAQDHSAVFTAPESLVPVLVEFFPPGNPR